jgi:hypothetical protein
MVLVRDPEKIPSAARSRKGNISRKKVILNQFFTFRLILRHLEHLSDLRQGAHCIAEGPFSFMLGNGNGTRNQMPHLMDDD